MLFKTVLTAAFFMLFIASIKAQPDSDFTGRRDTVFVYDTLVIVDTVRIFHPATGYLPAEKLPAADVSFLEIENSDKSEKILVFSDGTTATLSDFDINSVNNFNSQNSTEMKKLGFLSIMLFAFQHMVLAQNDIAITAGVGFHNQVSRTAEASLFSPQGKIGINCRRSFANNRLLWSTGINYHYITKTKATETEQYSDIGRLLYGSSTEEIPTYHAFTLPVMLYGKFGKFNIGGGFELYNKSSKADTELITSPQTGEEFKVKTVNSVQGVGYAASMQYKISDRISAEIFYVRGISSENSFGGNLGSHTSIMQRVDLSVRYRLLKGKRE